jgi:hypothetical protein
MGGKVESKDALNAARTDDLVGRMMISVIAGCGAWHVRLGA